MRKFFLLIISLLFILPLFCLGQQKENNIKVYNEIFLTLKNNYPLFQYRSYYSIDSAYNKYKLEALNSKSETDLADCCCRMIGALEDFHVRIFVKEQKCFALSTPLNWHRIFHNDSLQKVFWSNSDSTLYKAGFNKMKEAFLDGQSPMIRYASSEGIGYLNITRFQLKTSTDFSRRDANALESFMDTLVKAFKPINALIIDLRSSMGGEVEYAELIASRLTKEKRQYSYTVQFKTSHDSLEPIKHYIIPKGIDQLNVPIVLLVNKVTRSAAEDFTLMVKQLPNVYLIGEQTWGALARSRMYKVSNGWKLQYSIEKVYSKEGIIYEGRGIPVDARLDHSWNDILSREDRMVHEALLYIQKNEFTNH